MDIQLYPDSINCDIEPECELCGICQIGFSENPTNNEVYTIPECNHSFHTMCILKWYKTGNVRCPYCNRTDIDTENFMFSDIKHIYKIITNYCRRKNANPVIKKKVEEIRKYQNKYKECIAKKTEIYNTIGVYKTLRKEVTKYNRNAWKNKRIVNLKKKQLCREVNILPFILK